jgi:hypothetical protein
MNNKNSRKATASVMSWLWTFFLVYFAVHFFAVLRDGQSNLEDWMDAFWMLAVTTLGMYSSYYEYDQTQGRKMLLKNSLFKSSSQSFINQYIKCALCTLNLLRPFLLTHNFRYTKGFYLIEQKNISTKKKLLTGYVRSFISQNNMDMNISQKSFLVTSISAFFEWMKLKNFCTTFHIK